MGSTASNSNNTDVDSRFLLNLKRYGTEVKRIELAGWNEMEDIRRLVECAPRLSWLDVGKKGSSGGNQSKEKEKTAANAVEWATILSTLADLTTFHGVKFFYEVNAHHANGASAAVATNISMADRSRIRKNDEIAPLLAWKCAKLRRVDHWEEGTGKVIVLIRDGEKDKDKVRWEVRRVKHV